MSLLHILGNTFSRFRTRKKGFYSISDIAQRRNELISDLSTMPQEVVFELSEAARIAHQKITQNKNSDRLREKSGTVSDDRLLVAFLYILMRDEITPGTIEGNLLKLSNETASNEQQSYVLTNGFLAKYAQDVADRLLANRKTGDAIQSDVKTTFRR